jgi:hypothetical protein
MGAVKKSWKKRWFCLLDNEIVYFKQQHDEKSVGSIKLAGNVGVVVMEDATVGRPHAFSVNPPGSDTRNYVFCAEDAMARASWVTALHDAMINLRANATLLSTQEKIASVVQLPDSSRLPASPSSPVDKKDPRNTRAASANAVMLGRQRSPHTPHDSTVL